jgi:tetratricopeptide (TPR) repeat protein
MKAHHMNMSTLSTLPWLAAIIGFAWATTSSVALASSTESIIGLYRSGKTSQALSLVDEQLANSPKDPQLQLLKGVILAETGRGKEARAIFQSLIVEYPQLPEPYNNLAVLYAAEGDYEKARTVLESAIKTNPSYATAHENLGDVYAKLASESYAKALNLQPRKEVQPKLRLINQVVAMTPAMGTAPKTTGAIPTATPPASTNTVSNAASEATPSVRGGKEVPALDTATQEAVRQAIERWRRSWSERNIQAYLESYDPEYSPSPGIKREQWINERTARIVPRKFIDVKIDNLKLEPGKDNNTVIARFTQHYRSDSLENRTQKELTLSRREGNWLIIGERSR